MTNKVILWIPIVGVFVCLVKYDKENGMGTFWAYYQSITLILLIWVVAFVEYG